MLVFHFVQKLYFVCLSLSLRLDVNIFRIKIYIKIFVLVLFYCFSWVSMYFILYWWVVFYEKIVLFLDTWTWFSLSLSLNLFLYLFHSVCLFLVLFFFIFVELFSFGYNGYHIIWNVYNKLMRYQRNLIQGRKYLLNKFFWHFWRFFFHLIIP